MKVNATPSKKEKMIKQFILVIAALVVVACSKEVPVPETRAPATLPVHVATLDEWKTALASIYTRSQVEDKGDGITKFMASFHFDNDKRNDAVAFGTRDEFRKLTIFQGGLPLKIATCVKTYVSLLDGKSPVLFLAPYYWSENGWLFMNKIAVMVDGDVVFERNFENTNVDRDTEGVGVAELYQFIATPEDITALRKIKNSSKILVRLSGTKGYVNLENGRHPKRVNATENFRLDIINAISIYDTINHATEGHLPP